MGYAIGFFKATNSGYEGKITTLLHNLTDVTFERLLDRTSENQPAFRIYNGELQLGAAWNRITKKGKKYISVNLEDPTFSSGFYSLWRNDGVEDGYTLVFERPKGKPKTKGAEQADEPEQQAA